MWHRVRAMRPRLRPHVQINRQRYRGRIWHVAHDPASNQFYRLNPIAHDLVQLLDGTRDVETAWKISLSKFGDAAPTQNEVIQLLSQLYNSNLLSVDTTPETEQLLRRGRERVKKKVTQQAVGIMYFRIRLFNPDRIITALEPLLRPLINRWGFLLWAAFVAWALVSILPHFGRLVEGFDAAISPANWPWLIAVFIVTKAIHEMGHGIICKRFGGQVPELGVMLLVLFPAPYVDASSCWAFANKWQRIAVGSGGMIFELFIASIAAFVWIGADPGSLAKQISYNAMLTASISTILFNANPLMRFDGYYILADLLETPNLMQRSNKMLQHLIQKYIYRLENLTPPATLPGERATLIIYGICGFAYRIFLFITITLFVMGKLFVVGLLLAIWTASVWFILPVGKFIHWLATSPQLTDKRAQTIGASVAMAAAGLLLLGAVPMPDYRRATGVVESRTNVGVYFRTDGFVAEVHARPGDTVEAGDPIVTLENPELVQRRRQILLQIDELLIEERRARRENEPAVAQVARERLAAFRDGLAELDRRIEGLVVRAPARGVLVGNDPAMLMGAYAERGEPVCEIVDPADVRVAALMDQRDAAWLFEQSIADLDVQLRFRSDVRTVLDGANVRRIDAAQLILPHSALGYAGGGQIEIDARDEHGRVARRPRFTVYVDPVINDEDGPVWAGAPGERVRLRFTLPRKPLLAQWAHRLHQVVQGRVDL